MEQAAVLRIERVSKTFASSERPLTVLSQVSLVLHAGESVALLGPSGSGKTTLLSLAAGLDTPSSGEIVLDGVALHEASEERRAALRRTSVGFVFQSFFLVPSLTALENVMVPLELVGSAASAREKARQLLERVGLGERLNHYPAQLSGGEQQRVALARAFVNEPRVLFADEPTGSLDAENAERATALLFELNHEFDTAMLIVTHNLELAARAQRTYRINHGQLEEVA